MSFAADLADERTARGLSKRRLALQAGVSPAYLTLLEQGRRTPGRPVVAALADALEDADLCAGRATDGALAPRLLASAGYAAAPAGAPRPRDPGGSGAPADRPTPFRAPGALAAVLSDPGLSPAARRVLDGLVWDVVAALHRQALGGQLGAPTAAERRKAVATLLAPAERQHLRQALEAYRSPMYDL